MEIATKTVHRSLCEHVLISRLLNIDKIVITIELHVAQRMEILYMSVLSISPIKNSIKR